MQIRRTTTVQNTNAINLKTQNKTSSVSTENTIPVDQLEISAEAQAIQSNTEIRTDKVAEVRQQIAAGQYETADKIEVAVDRMLDEIA
jgi:negative regulator of flagellin synthesis FlgM